MKMIILVLLLCGLLHVNAHYQERNFSERFQLSRTCPRLRVDVAEWDTVAVRSTGPPQPLGPVSVPAGATCRAYFKTSLPGHGLCVRMHGVFITSPTFQIAVQTNAIAPDIIIRRGSRWDENWCFPHKQLVITITTSGHEDNINRAVIFRFTVTNVTLDKIPKHYYMDSFSQCGLGHELASGEEAALTSDREPPVSLDVPEECELRFSTSSGDEYEQVCVRLTVTSSYRLHPHTDHNHPTSLNITGLYARFYTNEDALNENLVCSENKRLTIRLVRHKNVTFRFLATVSSQWYPHWEEVASEASELRGLRVVKGITYFIATIDSLVAVLAACLAAVLKRPTGPWRRWTEHFTAHAPAHTTSSFPPQDQGHYGSMHTCKDDSFDSSISSPGFSLGNYPELPLEGATSTNEVLVEAHTY